MCTRRHTRARCRIEDRDTIFAQVTHTRLGCRNCKQSCTAYFAARSLGWHVYLPYIQYNYDEKGNWIQKDDYKPENKLRELLSKMDYAVFPKGEVSLELSDQLRQSGLIYKSTMEIGGDNKKHLQSSGRTMDIILWFLRGSESYGPYVLYTRQQQP